MPAKKKKEMILSRTSILPSDQIVASFTIILLGIVLRDKNETERETGWESLST